MVVLSQKVARIAKQNPQGFTFNIRTRRMVTSGIIAAYHATQDCFGTEGLHKALAHAEAHAGIIGGWFNVNNGNFYFDSCNRFTSLAEAIAFGKEQQQIAIFDLDQMKEIRL
jgi:hypothetical protein